MTVGKLQTLLAAWLAATCMGCGADEGDLDVEVTTDHVPDVEFASVRAALFDDLPTSGGTLHLDPVTRANRPEDDWIDGVRVARFENIERRGWTVQAELIDASGNPIASRFASTTLRGSSGLLRLHIAREAVPPVDGGGPGTPDAGPTDGGPDASSSDEDGGEGPPADGGSDGATGVSCATDVDGTTVAFYDFEADSGGTTLTDELGANPGTWNGGVVATATGPTGCGQVLVMPGSGGDQHGEIPDDADWNLSEGSVDFWLRIDATPAELVGLVGRDESGTGTDGHLSVWLTHERILLVRLQNPDGIAVRCSGPLSIGWHHVGLSFGGDADLEVWVDGSSAAASGEVLVMNPDENTFTCGGSTTRGIRGNDNPWVIGANTAFSDRDLAGPLRGFFRTGALDRIRISDVRRTF